MIDKTKGSYVRTLLSNETIELLKRFSKLTGYSQSFILKTIIEVQLSQEVDLYLKKMEVINNEKTKTFS